MPSVERYDMLVEGLATIGENKSSRFSHLAERLLQRFYDSFGSVRGSDKEEMTFRHYERLSKLLMKR